MILITAHKAEVHEGTLTRCLITCVRPDTGLVLQLLGNLRGRVDITDLSETYTDQPTSTHKVGDVIMGYVEELNAQKQSTKVSCRSQR